MVGLCPNSEGHCPVCAVVTLSSPPLMEQPRDCSSLTGCGDCRRKESPASDGWERGRWERSRAGGIPQPLLLIPVFLTAHLSCARGDHNKCADKMLSNKHASVVNFVSPALQEEQRWFPLFLEVDTFSSHSSCSCWELPTSERFLHGGSASVMAEGRSEGSIFFIPWGNIQILVTAAS